MNGNLIGLLPTTGSARPCPSTAYTAMIPSLLSHFQRLGLENIAVLRFGAEKMVYSHNNFSHKSGASLEVLRIFKLHLLNSWLLIVGYLNQ